MARLRRWWALHQLTEQEAGLQDARSELLEQIAQLQRRQWLSRPTRERAAAIEVRRLELIDLDWRLADLQDRIAKHP
jgi:hypothetical protein